MNPQTVRQTAFKIGGLSNIYKLQGMTGGFWNTRVVPKDLKMTNWWFFTNPFEKYAQVKLDHLPRVRGENKKRLKPPPSNWLDMNRYSIQTTRRWQKQDTQMLNMLLYMYELHKLGVNLLLAILCDLFGWLSDPFRPFKGFPRPPTRGSFKVMAWITNAGYFSISNSEGVADMQQHRLPKLDCNFDK